MRVCACCISAGNRSNGSFKKRAGGLSVSVCVRESVCERECVCACVRDCVNEWLSESVCK